VRVCAENRRAAGPDLVEIGYTWLAASAQRTRCAKKNASAADISIIAPTISIGS